MISIRGNIFTLYKEKEKINKNNKADKYDFIKSVESNKVSLYRVAKGILKNEHDTEDAISETLLKAYSNLDKLKKKESFKPWIIKILVNECYKILKLKNKVELSDDMESYNLSYENVKDDYIITSINKLDDNFREILILFYYEDMSLKEISNILDIPVGTVKSRLSRGKEKLKIVLSKEEVL